MLSDPLFAYPTLRTPETDHCDPFPSTVTVPDEFAPEAMRASALLTCPPLDIVIVPVPLLPINREPEFVHVDPAPSMVADPVEDVENPIFADVFVRTPPPEIVRFPVPAADVPSRTIAATAPTLVTCGPEGLLISALFVVVGSVFADQFTGSSQLIPSPPASHVRSCAMAVGAIMGNAQTDKRNILNLMLKGIQNNG